ncbi:rhamnan synthesis F family protein [Bowmanella yangjiangensis]|uniref:Glycosyl transferase family 1 n=1 Tax=Bowmanella yangjiangensis TaxID=2811230 RepID=A0ABS3CVV1_9ALTE|nr:rhamnan synthesis F family protein [Bowmanella yangjiangensis]MBN7820450.1 glycosyl transferase family 1 [Bowmanella yangjiangensis]
MKTLVRRSLAGAYRTLTLLLRGREFLRVKRQLRMAKNAGVFDLEWYQQHYGMFRSEVAAFEDYLAKAHYANVNPSAKFDTEHYLRTHLDIYHSGNNPLLHYLYNGRYEGRSMQEARPRWLPSGYLVANETPTWHQQKVAICLHIYYPDFVDKFLQCLKNFPLNVDVFVACASEEICQDVTRRYSKLKRVGKLQVARVPNRGRNFGPLLVEFGPALLEYDLMCHLHSKKSLYSGREQTQWFDYLNQYLFKDKHVVSCLLRLFDEHPELGIYYPTSFWMMPPWVNHWTCNKPFAKEFESQWGIDLTQNFISYPVGGMFWARPKALKPLLEKVYKYEDFPAEPLPNDGSWLHALERAVGLLAEKSGYKQFFYYPPAGHFTDDKSHIFAGYHKPPEQLFTELRRFDHISFDVFDTVLSRKLNEPDYAKYQVGLYLQEQGLMPNAQSFVSLRNETEFALRKQHNFAGDVCITQVYDRLAVVMDLDSDHAKGLMELEFDLDMQQIVAKQEMVDLVHKLSDLNKTIWFISDTYYSHQQVETLLRKVGITAPFRLFVSSELGFRKDRGDMWQHISELVSGLSGSYIHVGDNVRSDAQLCGDHGLTNLHILHPNDKWQAAGMPPINSDNQGEINEANIFKWGPLVSNLGRYPFFGE